MHEKNLHKGEMVLFSLATAHLDSKLFSDPGSFDSTRKENEHLAFGKGIHHCQGVSISQS
ncbi:cytochrome P450 [Paenibacillus sp. CAU 1523]|uniref:Cytochrome P450 n=2 Tax=Paenibacillus arenosi TaxID=2774142 RepID=A0ABR9AZJ6_9BACL|nr:cytochrome P450 [Paenibacillus arenosi]